MVQRQVLSLVLSVGLAIGATTPVFAQAGGEGSFQPAPPASPGTTPSRSSPPEGQQGSDQIRGPGQTPPPLPIPNCDVNPANTADPAAVMMARQHLAEFFAMTNRMWSVEGYSSAEAMRTTLGNAQSDWYDQTVALACGRLQGGYRGMNWRRGMGWGHW
ncbi:MAG: hypothetical protein M3O34_02480 [Chloroflexota bacterium]|nr:hypothetical protein [Chloroflexota bacterium]